MEFVQANWHLFFALGAVLAMLVWAPLVQRIYGIRNLTNGEAVRLMNHEQGVVLDVCEAHEYRNAHIPGAVSAPLSQLRGRVQDLAKYRDRPVIVSCRSGNRSVRGAMVLRKQGFARVYSLAGGLTSWQKDNLPTEKD